MWNKLLSWGKGIGGKALGAGGRGLDWYGRLGSTAQGSILGAGAGALTGAFGLNPFNALPFVGDIDAGGGIGGALAGAAAGAAYGRFGARRGGRNLIQRGLAGGSRMIANTGLLVPGKSANLLQRAAGGLYSGMTGPRMTAFSNRHGHQVLAGLAAGSAGLIGGSVLSTNRPY